MNNIKRERVTTLAGVITWIKEKAESSEHVLLQRIARSLERDRKVPLSFLLRKALIYFISMLMGRFNLRRCDRVGKRPRTRRKPYIENMGKLIIGNDVNINSRNVQTDLVTGPEGTLEIGDEASINFGVSIVANKKIKIGNRIRIGPYTMIYDSSQHVHGQRFKRAEGAPVVIEDDVWLASRVMVLKGSRIGRGSLVAAGSVVSGIIPPYVVAGGMPARVIKYLDSSYNSGFFWEHNGREKVIKEDTSDRVRKTASEVFSADINSIRPEHSHYLVPGWNSFQHAKFVHALEREFNIRIKKEDWVRMSSIAKSTRVVQKYVNQKYKGQKPAKLKNY